MLTLTDRSRVHEQVDTDPGKEYLAFTLGREEYGIDILHVQEIRGFEPVTRIANTPPFILGVVNLRGTIVPVVDMRLKLGLGEASYDRFTVVIILNIGARTVGMVVDSVSDVVMLHGHQLREAPEVGVAFDSDDLTGLADLGERMLILVDIQKLMTRPDMGLVDKLAA